MPSEHDQEQHWASRRMQLVIATDVAAVHLYCCNSAHWCQEGGDLTHLVEQLQGPYAESV